MLTETVATHRKEKEERSGTFVSIEVAVLRRSGIHLMNVKHDIEMLVVKIHFSGERTEKALNGLYRSIGLG